MLEFDYHRPTTLEEAAELLERYGDDARVMAGGTALMLALRQRLVQPMHVISLSQVEQLRGIRGDASGGLRIGALTLHNEIASSEIIRLQYPMLATLASEMANPQVRNQGTLGGNLCYADPSTDPPGALLALGARVKLQSSRTQREIPLSEFLLDYFTTTLESDEVLVEICLPPSTGWESHYKRFLKTAADHRPLVTVAANARKRAKYCEEIRIVIGASTVIPCRASQSEAYLQGRTATPESIVTAAEIASEEATVIDDIRGSADYRKQMIRVTVKQVLSELFRVPENMKETS